MAYLKKKIPREVRWLRDRLERFEHIIEKDDREHPGILSESKNNIADVKDTVKNYNEVLNEADALRNELDELVKTARNLHERLRMTIVAEFGRDSIEYEQIGGTRPSDIDYSRNNHPNNQQQQ